jgi:ABC-type transport system involved in cytochrome bd biosynthesis fused ATPase/permease subunit
MAHDDQSLCAGAIREALGEHLRQDIDRLSDVLAMMDQGSAAHRWALVWHHELQTQVQALDQRAAQAEAHERWWARVWAVAALLLGGLTIVAAVSVASSGRLGAAAGIGATGALIVSIGVVLDRLTHRR